MRLSNIQHMEKAPKHNIYKVPEGYFDTLPDRVFRKKKRVARQVFIYRAAAAAVLAIGFTWFAVRLPYVHEVPFQAEIDQEVEFYINSGYWDAEDVISLSDNPDELLDWIIAEEWSGFELTEEALPEEDLDY